MNFPEIQATPTTRRRKKSQEKLIQLVCFTRQISRHLLVLGNIFLLSIVFTFLVTEGVKKNSLVHINLNYDLIDELCNIIVNRQLKGG